MGVIEQLEAISNPLERTTFFNAHKDEIRKAFVRQNPIDRLRCNAILWLRRTGVSQTQLCQVTRIPPSTLSGFLNNRHALPSDAALKLERIVGH